MVRLTANDGELSTSVDLQITVNPDPSVVLPPDPATVAPPLDGTIASTVADGTSFLYTGANPIQTGVPPATIDPKRATVLRGKVITPGNAPQPGVTISILDHPEFGQTLSRADGMFDLVVNGGAPLTVSYTKPGLLPAQRQLAATWQRFVFAPDVVLVPLQAAVTPVDLSAATPMQIVRGAVVTDTSGTRQATLMFPAGTTASMTLPGGGSSPLTQLTVRATEYTVGANGPKAMPGELPPTSAYTYAVEFSIDEALTAGATSVVFSQPVISYVENFLGFPVGWDVPTGFYDHRRGNWVSYTNGRVIKVLGTTGGLADLDIDGSGLPANAGALAALGITAAERQSVASLYATGQSLWRVPLSHFSPRDMNWGGGLPLMRHRPISLRPRQARRRIPASADGSIIECQSQTLGQRLAVVGTPYTLNYRSSRAPGYKAANRLLIPLSGASVPASLQSIELEVLVAGRQFTQSFPPTPNQSTTFVWDGKDAYGRTMQGQQVATVRIGYTYRGVYTQRRDVPMQCVHALWHPACRATTRRTVLTLWQEWQVERRRLGRARHGPRRMEPLRPPRLQSGRSRSLPGRWASG